jgi:malonyl-CoA O-methyltransferase
MNTKEKIKTNFSRYASNYDSYSAAQSHAGSKLISYITPKQFKKILDIGCGTGNFTKLLIDKFPQSAILALDISGKMIQMAKQKLKNKQITFLIADAETTAFNEHFDLITSNACFQWFNNLEQTLMKYESLLEDNGIILFSTFGPRSLYELNSSLNKLYQKDIAINSHAFIKKDQIKQFLQKYFDRTSIEEQAYKHTYASLWQLLNTIKYTGAQGTGLNGQKLTRTQITKLEKIYKENFNKITATYQIF